MFDEECGLGWVDLRLADRRNDVGRDEDAEHRDVDGRDDAGRAPFENLDSFLALGDDRNSVDDDLQQQLNLKDPESQDCYEDGHAAKEKPPLACPPVFVTGLSTYSLGSL